MLYLVEIFYFHKSASIAFDRSNVLWAKPKPLWKAKREN